MSEPQSIRAAVLPEIGAALSIEQVLVDPPRPGEVLVRIAAAGVCHSDLHLADGHLGEDRAPIVLGHEGAGVVEAVGEGVSSVAPGERVALSFVPACGECRYCRAGRSNLCVQANEQLVRGSAARRHHPVPAQGRDVAPAVPRRRVLRRGLRRAGSVGRARPGELPLWQAALVGCAVVTGIRRRAQRGARASRGERLRRRLRRRRTAGDRGRPPCRRRSDRRRRPVFREARAARSPGARPTPWTPPKTGPHEPCRKLTDGGVDHAFEVVGRPETIRLAWDALRPGGTAVVVGLAPRGVDAAVPASEFLSEKSLRGCFYGSGNPAREIAELAALAASGGLDLAGSVSHITDLEGIEEAFARLRRGEGARTVAILDRELADAPDLM